MSENQSLKEKTAKGLLWGGFSNGMQQLLNLAFGIFIARQLTASDYGMVGVLSIFSLIAGTLQESGFIVALANKKEVTHKDYNAVFWFSCGLSFCLYMILFLCAPLIACFYDIPALTPLARYSFLSFVIASLGTAHSAYLFRNLKVKQKAISQMIALVLSGVTGVTMAFLGYAYWGLATQSMVYISVVTIGYWYLSPWRPTLSIDFSPLKSIFSFSFRILLTTIFGHFNNNLFSIILGKFYSEKEVGYFNQANKWNNMGHSFITSMISGVAQPILSQVAENRERQLQVFRKMLRFTAFISFPAMLGFSFVAPELVEITITDKWLGSVEILQILCIGGSCIPIATLYSNLIISRGKPNIHMWSTICQGIVQIIVVFALYPYGINTMVTAYITINIGWLFIWHFFVRQQIRLSLWQASKDILPYTTITLVCITITFFITRGITNIYLLCVSKIILTAILYIIFMWISNSATFKECISYLYHKYNRNNER